MEIHGLNSLLHAGYATAMCGKYFFYLKVQKEESISIKCVYKATERKENNTSNKLGEPKKNARNKCASK